MGKRQRRIRARSAPGQVAGAAKEKPGLKAHRAKTACPTCVLPKPLSQSPDPNRAEPSDSSLRNQFHAPKSSSVARLEPSSVGICSPICSPSAGQLLGPTTKTSGLAGVSSSRRRNEPTCDRPAPKSSARHHRKRGRFAGLFKSGRQDLNLRPPGPQRDGWGAAQWLRPMFRWCQCS